MQQRRLISNSVIGNSVRVSCLAALQLALGLAGIGSVGAQSVGWAPRYAMIQAGDGSFYGTTNLSTNGYGTIFKLTPSGKLITLHNFSLSDGSQPNTLTLGQNGTFYGTTLYGGAYGWGTMFQMKPGGALTALYTFTGGNDGRSPGTLTLGQDGNFYGTTNGGGAGTAPNSFGPGTIFRITPSGTLTTLYSFTGGSDGYYPSALILGKDGNFYGTTIGGGANNLGTVFQITPSGTFSSLYSFAGASDGANPYTGLTLGKDGNLYGTTTYGGANNWGTVFQITPSGTLTPLYSFTGGSDGGAPSAALTLGKDGNFYGTNSSGGTMSYGVIFQVTPSGTLTTLYNYLSNGVPGFYSYNLAGLTQGKDGNFYSVTQVPPYLYRGAPTSGGTLFKMTPSGEVTTLYTFTWAGFGWNPDSALTEGLNGDLYGTTANGGLNNAGTIFTYTPGGKLKVLYNFDGDEGAPSTALTHGKDHNFYGVTPSGGADGEGTIYRITPSGAFTTLYNFTGGSDGANPMGALTLGRDGNFYGTAEYGGAAGNGTVFKITPSGTFTLLYSFTAYDPTTVSNADGAYPMGTLVLGRDGNFYGETSYYGGAYGWGTVFQVTPSGTLTPLYSFTGGSDGYAGGALTLGKDGNFYGTTEQDGEGISENGTIFQITPSGALTTLYTFTGGSDGAYPNPLTLGSDGNFYGMTLKGGADGFGTMFQITPVGVFTVLPSYVDDPNSLTLGKDGAFYGTNSALDSAGYSAGYVGGGIFRVTTGGVLTTLWNF